MFKIEAYVRPFVVDELLNDLQLPDVRVLSCIELDAAKHGLIADDDSDLLLEKRVRIDVLVGAEMLEGVIQLFKDRLATQMRGGAELVVLAVADVIEVSVTGDATE